MDITFEKVTRSYPPFATALRELDLYVPHGQRVAVLGPSGAGKSTLLAIAGLLDRPTSGRYSVGDTDSASLGDRRLTSLRAREIGFVFQAFHLIPHLTSQENVEIGLALMGVRPRDRRGRAASALELVGLAQRTSSFPSMLSGGEQQRVAIARALVRQPSILLCDEPTGNLDSTSAGVVLDAILGPSSSDRTTIVVTHNQEVATRCDRVVHIVDGRLTSDELIG